MCGIAGILGDAASPERIEHMVSALAHRGPDGRGTWVGDGIALGHTRLAIIDLDPRSDQPFWSADGRRVCTYNGEIYNYPQLRSEATSLRTSCDTEMLVEWPGGAVLEMTAASRGMFAFAVHDVHAGTTVIVRDRFAMKPLYVASIPGGVVFASEQRALLASGLIDGRIAPSAVPDMLRYGAMVHPRTALAGVRRLEPGTLAHVGSGVTKETAVPISPGQHPVDLAESFRDSVSAHLLADVEVGLFLSGGTDSSVIARCIGDLSSPARAVTLCTPGIADEHDQARETARHYGLDFEAVEISEDDCLQICLDYFDAMDAPATDGLNTYTLARAAARTGLKVCLSGTGGDEMLGGYQISSRLRYISRLSRVPGAVRQAASRVMRLSSNTRPRRRLAAAIDLAGHPELFDLAHRVFLEDEVQGLVTSAADLEVSRLDPEDRRGYLRDVLLADADVFGMANGVEIRVPYVDGGFMASVDAAERVGRVDKAALVSAFHDDFLTSKLGQPKRGFTMPIDRWLRGPLAGLVDRLLDDPPLCLSQFLDPGAVAAHAHSWRSCLGPHSGETWALVALYQWGDRHDARLKALV